MARPALTVSASAALNDGEFLEKGERVFVTALPIPRLRRTIEVSTLVTEGERERVRVQPFALATMILGAHQPNVADYPDFDPLSVFAAEEGEDESGGPGVDTRQIYDVPVEPDVALSMEPFDFAAALDTYADLGTDEAERSARRVAGLGEAAPTQIASLGPFDAGRFDLAGPADGLGAASALRIVEENVSIARADGVQVTVPRYREEVLLVREEQEVLATLESGGFTPEEAEGAASALTDLLGRDTLEPGEVLRLGIKGEAAERFIVRVSAYRGERHLRTVAVGSDGRFVSGPEPALSRQVAQAFDANASEAPLRSNMPSVYDGVFQAALANGLDQRLSRRLVRMIASDVDLQSRLSPRDRLTILYSLEEGQEEATADSEILFVETGFGDTTRRYYRFWSAETDTVDYFDEEGRSASQFLIRNPVPRGRFTSPYGERRHPILGYRRMHSGVDWAAPRGTPILASGAGTVVSAGWSSGYGRQTVIRHANGYETSYSHQHTIADGVKAGATVRQGQVIGTVGSTGLSTGNHLHYEMKVNGRHVDPLRVRLPSGETLQGEELEAFRRERGRIDALMEEGLDEMRLAGR